MQNIFTNDTRRDICPIQSNMLDNPDLRPERSRLPCKRMRMLSRHHTWQKCLVLGLSYQKKTINHCTMNTTRTSSMYYCWKKNYLGPISAWYTFQIIKILSHSHFQHLHHAKVPVKSSFKKFSLKSQIFVGGHDCYEANYILHKSFEVI